MKSLSLRLPENGIGFIVVAKPELNCLDYEEEAIRKLVDFLKETSPAVYQDLEREMTTRNLARDFSSEELYEIEMIAQKSFHSNGKMNSYGCIQEAKKRRYEEEQKEIPF